jgi:hypothetical protein
MEGANWLIVVGNLVILPRFVSLRPENNCFSTYDIDFFLTEENLQDNKQAKIRRNSKGYFKSPGPKFSKFCM